MRDISEAIVAGSLQAIIEHLETEHLETAAEIEKRRVDAGEGNRAERRRVAALERKKAKRLVGSNPSVKPGREAGSASTVC